MANGTAPISGKVSNGTLTGLASAAVTWILTTYIPAFHSGIPPQLAPLIPALVGAAGYFIAGYRSKHKATTGEIESAVAEMQKVLAALDASGGIANAAAAAGGEVKHRTAVGKTM